MSTVPVPTALLAKSPNVTTVRSISWSTTTVPGGGTVQGGVITADAVIEERSDDDSVITENPVENGSVTNDHAFDLPQSLELTYAWSGGSRQAKGQSSFLNTTYAQFLTLKQAKILLFVVTGKRQYQNMLIKSLSVTTDEKTENVLLIRISLKQLLLTVTQTVTISSADQQSLPQKTQPTINGGQITLQPGSNFNSGTPKGS
jgi:hypothetical protein